MNTLYPPPWHVQLWRRIVTLAPLKAVGTSIFMALFFTGYFAVMGGGPFFSPTVMPLIFLDAWIPFVPAAFWAYVSLWVYVSLPPALMADFRTLIFYGIWVASLCLFCLGIFWLVPTEVPVADIDWQLYPDMAVIKGLDAGGNACPSLHVASAVFSACWLQRVLSNVGAPRLVFWLNWVQCLLIVWSTVAIRQHVVLDVFAGALIGLIFAVLSLRHMQRRFGVRAL
jgi:membrane-associated phospholipid phosphatase